MAVTPFNERLTLAAGGNTVFTAGSGGAIVTNIILCNTSSSAVTVTITLRDKTNTNSVPFVSGAAIPANGTVTFDIKQHLVGTNGTVIATPSSGSVLAMHVSGVNL